MVLKKIQHHTVGKNEAINSANGTFSTEDIIVPTFVTYDDHQG